MKTSPYFYLQPNSLFYRTAIEREQKQFIKIAFAVHLSAVISAERYRSDSGALKSAMLTLVYFYIIMIVHKCQQSAKRKLLLNKNSLSEVFPLTVGNGKTMAFENRHDGCKEREKINRRRIFDTLRINFFEATPQTACIFSKEYYRYDANGNITAEKDGKFSDKEEITFTYSYFAEHDVYGVDYGFDLEPPEDDPANLESGGTTSTTPTGGYRRDYTWNERNLLIKSDDKLNTVIYRYGDDGQRALKFTQQSNSETLYFNNFYSVHQVAHEPNHEHGLRVSKHIFVGNSRLVTAMTHADNHGDTTEQTEKRYYYHADHLQSAQFITNVRGEQYEHIEYTPYGELWIEETAPGIDKLPFRFTGKELDEETGLYYYGARYLDPKYSRWLSGDPALGEYIPQAPIDDEAKKHNENLPGLGGVYNTVNLHVYHYAGNNPVKYVDPDGRNMEDDLAKSLGNTSKKQGVDLNLFTANPKQDLYDAHEPEFGNMRQAASRAYKYAAFFYVAAHGNRVNASSCGEDGSLNYEDRAFLSPEALAEMIKSNSNYNGQPVVLWICNSGQDPQNIDNSQDCFAEKVADALGQGAIVIASTGFVNFKSGIFIQTNRSGNKKNSIPYASVDSGEQYKFIGGK